MAIVYSILSLLTQMGLEKLGTHLEYISAKNQDVSRSALTKELNNILSNAQSLAADKYQKLINGLASIEGIARYTTGSLKSLLSKGYGKQSRDLRRVEKKLKDVEDAANKVQDWNNRVNESSDLARASNSADWKSARDELLDEVGKVEQSLGGNYVSKTKNYTPKQAKEKRLGL